MTIGEERSFLDQLMDLYRAGDPSATDDSPGTQMVRIVQAIYLQIALGDYAAAVEWMTDDFTMEIIGPAEIPLVGCWRGKAEAEAALARNFSLLEDQAPQLIGVATHRDAVVVMGRETGRVKATGHAYAVHWVQWFTLRDGRLCRFLQLFDSDELSGAFRK
jgi:uncharacterized protein